MEIITARYILTMREAPLMGWGIAIENGEIIDVASESDLLRRYPHARVKDYPDHAVVPGLVNAHTHLDMTLHRNFPLDPVRETKQDVDFVSWLLECWDYKSHASSQDLRQAVGEGIELCIDSGITCVGDMSSYSDMISLMEASGLRAVVFPEILSYDSFVAKDLYQTAMALVDDYLAHDFERVHVGLGPYAPFALSRNILKIMAQFGRHSSLPLMMHAAQSFAEMEFFYDASGEIASRLFPIIGWGDDMPPQLKKTPIDYLADIEFLAAQPIIASATHLSRRDWQNLQTFGAKLVWTPRSSQNLGNPPLDWREARKYNISMALGTDGMSSVSSLSMWDEMRAAWTEAASHDVSACQIFKMATIQAAQVLGMDNLIGSLEIGKRADYVVVDMSEREVTPENIFQVLIENTKSYHVHAVAVDGKVLKSRQ